MHMKRVLGYCVAFLLSAATLSAAVSDLADAAMKGNKAAVRSLLQKKADVNGAQTDGTTALHWAVRLDDLETVDLLIRAGANVSTATRAGATPLSLAAINGNPAIIEKLVKAGANPNTPLTKYGDTLLMMAARTGNPAAIKTLLDNGAQINAMETWGGTTALMWAVSESHPDAAKVLIDSGANVNVRSKIVPSEGRRGGSTSNSSVTSLPRDPEPGEKPKKDYYGGFTPLHFAVRQGDVQSTRLLVAAGADVNAISADGKASLELAIYNGNYELASFLIDNKAQVNHADAEGFTPLFWAVDRRNMETNPGMPWMVTLDPLPLIKKLLAAGADPNAFVDNIPTSRRSQLNLTPRTTFATALARAAFSADLELVQLLLSSKADPNIVSSHNETALMQAAGYAWIDGYSRGKSNAERLEVIKLLVRLGANVNAADDAGITALMGAGNFGDLNIIQYLVDVGADLGAHDLGKKNDGQFGGSIEPLMAVDYAIGVGTFRPNNSIVLQEKPAELMLRLMKEKGIKHTTSECTLRGFTCGDVDPMGASAAEIAKARAIAIGNQVEGITGGLGQTQSQNK
ncbi:MAG TPA: ankyrin repeat domain-containing protein [Terriglobia bacterium]|nr:ankyrin repeat domain-containing protein [Terriglobia bacterium]